MSKWKLEVAKANDLTRMAEILDISETVAQVLINRGINTRNKATTFLNPVYNKIETISQAKDVDLACEILWKSISNNEKICIYGDYDVDGVTSTTIMVKGLKNLFPNCSIEFMIPDREKDGYGLTDGTVDEILKKSYDLLITCDNGIASINHIEILKKSGLKIIIIDHHEPPIVNGEETIPKADAVIDPKQKLCKYHFNEMCTGGLTFTFIKYFVNKYALNLTIEDELNIFSMLATICDIVPLVEDNRVIVKTGLDLINSMPNINKGLSKLLEKKGFLEKKITVYTVGFVIGPCINASGRLEVASKAVDLFLSDDDNVIEELATSLVELNEERKEITNTAFENVIKKVENSEIKNDKVLVIYEENIHESVAGIVAGRIKEKYYKPTIVLTKGSDCAKGSARSIEGYNIFEAMSEVKDLFNRFGGHSMAAGLSLEYDNIDTFRIEINKRCTLKEEDFIDTLKIEKKEILKNVTFDNARQLEILQPFGASNKEPLFLSEHLKVESLKMDYDKRYFRLSFSDDTTFQKITGIGFGLNEKFTDDILEKYGEYFAKKIVKGVLRGIDFFVDVVYNIEVNEYRGNFSVQMKIKDIKLS